jgi:D-sedoheptulose 7-phosphate isomerase
MLEQRIQQQFFQSADLQYECAESLARQVAQAAQALLNTLTSGGKVLLLGVGASHPIAQYAHTVLVGRFERERPPLAAVLLAPEALAVQQLLALAHAGDTLLLLDDPAAGAASTSICGDCCDAAHTREANVVAISRLRPATWSASLTEADVVVAVPHERPARVLEGQLLVLHALCDALDTQLLGEQDP